MRGGLREESPLMAFHLLLDPLLCICIARERKRLLLIYVTGHADVLLLTDSVSPLFAVVRELSFLVNRRLKALN